MSPRGPAVGGRAIRQRQGPPTIDSAQHHRDWLAAADVLFPYLNGQELNSDPTCSAGHWVINFHDWHEQRAQEYRKCYAQVLHEVKQERTRNNTEVAAAPWWQYWRRRGELQAAITDLQRVVVITRVSKIVMPVMVPTGQVISDRIVVFASDDTAMLALLSSELHHWWARTWTSTLETRVNYALSDVFETFPLPPLSPELRTLGDTLDIYRRNVMLARNTGLTKTYNRRHPGLRRRSRSRGTADEGPRTRASARHTAMRWGSAFRRGVRCRSIQIGGMNSGRPSWMRTDHSVWWIWR